ncbi:MAG: hypothetical protein DRN25_07665 [Thermoplasmata archaeon]|nr:MAG: hypothetical protein DRN25_07665 [Thermoplasmata archaeon]
MYDDTVSLLANILLVAAKTAPKAKGIDDLVTKVITNEKEKLAKEMEKIAKERGKKFEFFSRDAKSVRKSQCIILIGVKFKEPLGLDCGGCGFNCGEVVKIRKRGRDFCGPICAFKLLDLGIAIGSLVFQAKQLCIDNRVMYTIGAAALRLGLIDADIVMGIPLSVSGKNIYFDR